jgi:hypothetical protein
VSFSWDSVASATHYLVGIGTAEDASNITTLNTEVPVLMAVYHLWPGLYYWRVQGVVGGVPGSPTPDQVVYVLPM